MISSPCLNDARLFNLIENWTISYGILVNSTEVEVDSRIILKSAANRSVWYRHGYYN